MHRKLWEFLHLQQGTDSVYEYIRKFYYLQQYGGYYMTYHSMLLCAVIEQEGTYQSLFVEEEKMRKKALSVPPEDSTKGAPSKCCLVYTPSAGKS
jgi:fructose-1,6-bisphosphatase